LAHAISSTAAAAAIRMSSCVRVVPSASSFIGTTTAPTLRLPSGNCRDSASATLRMSAAAERERHDRDQCARGRLAEQTETVTQVADEHIHVAVRGRLPAALLGPLPEI